MNRKALKILLIEDDLGDRVLVERTLQKGRQAFSLTHCESLADALVNLARESFDVALLDLSLPDSFGLTGMHRIHEQFPDLPFVVLTGLADDNLALQSLEQGAQDYLVKGTTNPEILERTLLYAIQRQQIKTENRCLIQRMKALVNHDSLTGALNRQAFTASLEREWNRAERHQLQLSCAMLDIDFFKRVNDSHGHAVGDLALKEVTRILQEQIRITDYLGRLGGEEFCVLLPETGEQDALLWAERAREKIAESTISFDGGELRLTVSFGVSSRQGTAVSAQQMLEYADEAMLLAKQRGRNQVFGYHGMHEQSTNSESTLWEGVTIRDLLPDLRPSIAQNQPVATAIQSLKKHRVDWLVVQNSAGEITGIIRQVDVVSASFVKGKPDGLVADLMQTGLPAFAPETSAREVGEFLCRAGVWKVFVVEGKRIVGIVTRADLFHWLANTLNSDSQQKPSPVAHSTVGNECSARSPGSVPTPNPSSDVGGPVLPVTGLEIPPAGTFATG